MTNARAALFDDDDVDLSDFKVGQASKEQFPSKDDVAALSEQAGFPSREAPIGVTNSKENSASDVKRKPYNSYGGQKVQLNVRVTQDIADAFYRIAKENEWTLGQTLRKAILALNSQ